MSKEQQLQEKNFLFQLLDAHKKQHKKQMDYDSIEKKIKNYDKETPPSKDAKRDKGKEQDKNKNITELAFLGALIKNCKNKSKENEEVSKDFTKEIEEKNEIDSEILETNEEQKTSLLERLKFVFFGANVSEELDKDLANKSNLSLNEIEEELELDNNQDIEIGDDIFEEKEDDIEIGDDIFKDENQDSNMEIGDDIFKKEDIKIDEPEIGNNIDISI